MIVLKNNLDTQTPLNVDVLNDMYEKDYETWVVSKIKNIRITLIETIYGNAFMVYSSDFSYTIETFEDLKVVLEAHNLFFIPYYRAEIFDWRNEMDSFIKFCEDYSKQERFVLDSNLVSTCLNNIVNSFYSSDYKLLQCFLAYNEKFPSSTFKIDYPNSKRVMEINGRTYQIELDVSGIIVNGKYMNFSYDDSYIYKLNNNYIKIIGISVFMNKLFRENSYKDLSKIFEHVKTHGKLLKRVF